MQRLRLAFARGEAAKYISHLDLARLWERAVRRAGLPLAYSAGFTPHPRLSFAAPLAVGVTGDEELLEMYLNEDVPPAEVLARLGSQLPPGLTLLSVVAEEAAAASLQTRVRAAIYLARFRAAVPDLAARVADLLARERVPYERRREGKTKPLDLRPYVEELAIIEGRTDLTPSPPSLQGKGEPHPGPLPAAEETGERSAPLPLPAQAGLVVTPDDRKGAQPSADRPAACDSHPQSGSLPGREREAPARAEATGQVLYMRLRFAATGSVRPDEVLDALGLGELPVQLHRARLVLE